VDIFNALISHDVQIKNTAAVDNTHWMVNQQI